MRLDLNPLLLQSCSQLAPVLVAEKIEYIMQTFTVTEPFLDVKCDLGEGPFWEIKANVLRFVDIVGKAVYRVDLNASPPSLQKQQRDISIGVTAELAGSGDSFLFGGKHGIGIAKKSSDEYRYIQRFWNEQEIKDGMEKNMRANDGAVDSKGRFWVNTICDPEVTEFAPVGVVFRLDTDGSFHRMIEGTTIANGMSWSKDDKTFYFTDSPTGCIFAYDFDAETGTISNKRTFFKAPDEGTVPDGHTQDEQGNLYIAIYGGWKVLRVSPEGKITAEVKLPTRCPTCPVFCGDDLYITTASESQPEKYPESVKYGGMVFKCHIGVQGRPSFIARVPV